MKSYKQSLDSVQLDDTRISNSRKPTYRASAIFPVIHNKHYTTFVTFLGYWILKRNLREIGLLYTLRNASGNILIRKSFVVESAKSFVIELGTLLNEVGSEFQIFTGSLELEVFSSRDLVFPYPAFVICYYNDEFSTSVHTTGRVYNDIEDLQENTETSVPEAGFDIYCDCDREPFIAFVNGSINQENKTIVCKAVNQKLEQLTASIKIENIKPYETVFLEINKFLDLSKIINGNCGTISIKHDLSGFFPRFMAGNFQKYSFSSVSITHTFYDLSTCHSDNNYWQRISNLHEDSSILVPLFFKEELYTELIIYPIFSPSVFEMGLDFYDSKGDMLLTLPSLFTLDSKETSFIRIDFRTIAKEYNLDLNEAKAVNVIFDSGEDGKIPTRLKLGLNVGTVNKKSKLPCNICFAPEPGNPLISQKPGTFRWAPLLNVGKSVVVFTNSSTEKKYHTTANVTLKIFRTSDDKFINRQINIPARGTFTLSALDDYELSSFITNEVGWVAAISDNPYLNCWYFDFHKSGAVAGDHGF